MPNKSARIVQAYRWQCDDDLNSLANFLITGLKQKMDGIRLKGQQCTTMMRAWFKMVHLGMKKLPVKRKNRRYSVINSWHDYRS